MTTTSTNAREHNPMITGTDGLTLIAIIGIFATIVYILITKD
jgi:hypothetical protein